MKTIAIIAEYNPFHGGHAWQIRQARDRWGQDCAVMVALSGCFTQRGEPALLDKWTRTQMALDCGVDLVLELPFVYASSSAESFAAGGVSLLQATGLNCRLVFGSEAGQLEPLLDLARFLQKEPLAYKTALHTHLDSGLSFPAARQQAAKETLAQPQQADLLATANNILAVEYLKAIVSRPGCRLKPETIIRRGQAYTDRQWSLSPQQASASAIRQLLWRYLESESLPDQPSPLTLAELIDSLRHQMPQAALAHLLARIGQGPGPFSYEWLAPILISRLRTIREAEIDLVPGMHEGLGRRLIAAARRPGGGDSHIRLQQLINDTSTRRFPRTRIQRALLSLLTELSAEDLDLFQHAGGPAYIRVLGFSKKGRHLLKLMRRLAEKPIIMNGSDFHEYSQMTALTRMAELDCAATDLWFLNAGGTCGRDFDTPPIMR